LKRDGQTYDVVANESWNIQKHGAALSINQYSNSVWGERKITMVFNRE
jgi:hypothetical protein